MGQQRPLPNNSGWLTERYPLFGTLVSPAPRQAPVSSAVSQTVSPTMSRTQRF